MNEKSQSLRRRLVVYAPILLVTVVLALLGQIGVLSSNIKRYMIQMLLYITLGEAWGLLSGFAGITSLGQQLYIGLSGYAVAVVTSTYGGSLGLGIAAGVLVAIIVSLALSQVLFRMEGMYLAIGTWVAAEAMEKVFLNWRYVNQGSGMNIKLTPYPSVNQLFLIALVIACVTLCIVCVVLRSKLGLGLMAMRDDPVAASTTGVNLTQNRLAVYVLAAVLASLAGSLFFVNKGTIYPDSAFSVGWTVSTVFICIIGGSGTILGPVAGSILYVLLQEFLAHYPGWSNIMLGVITLVVILFLPDGIVGTLEKRFGLQLFTVRRR